MITLESLLQPYLGLKCHACGMTDIGTTSDMDHVAAAAELADDGWEVHDGQPTCFECILAIKEKK